MGVIEQVAQTASLGAQLILELRSSGMTVSETAAMLDISHARASLYLAIGKALNAQDLHVAAACGYSVDRLHELSSLEKRLKNPNVDVASLRRRLIKECAHMNHRELRLHIRALIDELNDGYIPQRAWYLRYSTQADADGMKYLIAKMPAANIERLHATLTPQARALAAHGTAVSEAEGHAMALYERCTSGVKLDRYEHVAEGETADNPKDLRHRPCILVPLHDAQALADGTVVNTDGELLDIKELVDTKIADLGFAVACYHDAEGIPRPQKVFEIKRLADADDRFLTIISHLVCQHADCDIPAVRCEIHHIQAFSRGGATTLENLCPLCRKHNLDNDDDPAIRKHGHVIKDPDTGMTWFSDHLGRKRRNQARVQQYNGMAYAQRVLGKR